MVAFVNIVSHSFFKKNQLNVSLPVMYYITVIIIPFVSIIIGYLTAVKLNIVSLICSVIILLINVDMFYLYDNLINLFSEKYENNIIEQQNKAYLNQLH